MPLFEQLGRLLVRQRWRFVLLILLLLASAGYSIYHRIFIQDAGIPINFTPQAIFMDNSDMIVRLQEIEKDFGREDNDYTLLIYGEALNTPEGKEKIIEFHKRMENVPQVESVRSLWNAKRLIGEDGFLEVEDIWDTDPFAIASTDPLLRGTLVSADHQTTIIQARIDPSLKKVQDLSPVVYHLQREIEQVSLPDNIQIMSTGVPFVRTEVVQMMLDDELFYIPVTATMFLLVIALLFKGIWVSLAPIGAVLIAVVWSVGVLLAFDVTFNLLSILVPTITLIIGVADGIHLLSRYREELEIDADREKAMGRTLHHMVVACFLTTFTTASGFLSLLVADTTVIRDFGLHSAVAVMIAFFSVIIVVPVWLSFVSVEKVGPPPINSSWEHRFFEALDQFVQKKTWITLFISVLLIGWAGFYGRTVRPNSSMLEMYQEDHPTTQAIRKAESELSGIVPLFISIEVNEDDVLDPELLEKALQVEKELRQFELIGWTYSFPRQLQSIHEKLSGETGLPDSRELISQELLMTSMAGELPMDRVLSDDKKIMRIIALAKDLGGREFLNMRNQMLDVTDDLFGDDPNLRVDVTGDGLIASVGIDSLISDLLSSVALVFAVIAAVMLILLRNVRLMIIACIPNAIPLIFTLATLRLIDSDLQISNIVSFTIAVGLAVDDTIHFIVRYKQEIEAGQPHYTAINKSFHGAGHAIILTSVLLVAGFGVLATSSLTTTYQFGLLASVTLATAIFADLFFLPALMHINARWSKQRLE